MWDFVMDESGAGAGFLRELRFPLPIYIPSASPQSSSLSPEAGTIGQECPQCQQPHKPEFKKKVVKPLICIPDLDVTASNLVSRFFLFCQVFSDIPRKEIIAKFYFKSIKLFPRGCLSKRNIFFLQQIFYAARKQADFGEYLCRLERLGLPEEKLSTSTTVCNRY
jgi:hypothetical protein